MKGTQSPAVGRLLPTDVRSLLLLVGYLGLLVVGVVNLIERDLTGIVPILAAMVGAFFVRGRLLSIGIWLGVAVFGLSVLAQRDLGGVLPLGVGLVGAVVGAWPDERLLRSLQVASATAGEAAEDKPEEAAEPAAFTIRSVGRIQLLAGEEDITSLVAERRLIHFALLRLLAMWVAGDDPYITRDRLSEELWPRLDMKTRRSRFRNLLHDFGELSANRPALAERLEVKGDLVTFNLTGCDFDVARLIELTSGVREKASDVLPRRLERRATKLLLELESGMFLPGWEELQQRVTGGRDASRQIVDAARVRVSNLRADLALAIARTASAGGRPGDGIPGLDNALQAAPDREDVASLLRSLYIKTGQDDKARTVREEYGLKELV